MPVDILTAAHCCGYATVASFVLMLVDYRSRIGRVTVLTDQLACKQSANRIRSSGVICDVVVFRQVLRLLPVAN